MGKQQQQRQQTLEFSPKCSSFLLYIIFKTVVFIRSFAALDRSNGLLYLGRETHMIVYLFSLVQ